jgi:RNA polymerase sigma factor (sigma-70 family)
VLRHLQTLYDVGTLTGLTDQELLARFQSANQDGDRAGAELVLAALIERHAAMVWGVCRALVRDPHDAEDAFQATFLILVRKAGRLRIRETLGSWLYVVAYRTGLGIRSAASRRRTFERAAAGSRAEATDPSATRESEGFDHDVLAVIHSEIMRLPGPSRAVVVLCDLEGVSYREAAGRLNLPMGTLQSRLARARQRLRFRLTLRGIGMPAPSDSRDSSPGWTPGMLLSIGLPRSLVPKVSRLCVTVAADSACMATIVSGSVQTLIRGGLRSMFYNKLKHVVPSLIGGVLVCGALLYADAKSGQPGQDGQPPRVPPERKKAEQVGPTERKTEIPAPRELKVVAGQGKILMYALDEQGRRIREQPGGTKKETEVEMRWAVVTGVLDHRMVQEWASEGVRVPLAPGDYIYRRVDLARQILEKDGTWSAWKPVAPLANLRILDNVPELEEERTPDEVRGRSHYLVCH